MFGTLWEPRQIKRIDQAKREGIVKNAEEEAKALIILERAKTQALIERGEIEEGFIQRVAARIVSSELEKQENLERIASLAFEKITPDKEVTNEPISDQWRMRFESLAGEVSEEALQHIWARILAGEVAEPGTTSLRTLNILSNLSKKEAEAYQKLSSRLCLGDFLISESVEVERECKDVFMHWGEVYCLINAGLLNPAKGGKTWNQPFPKEVLLAISNSSVAAMVKKKTTIDGFFLTAEGKELLAIIPTETNFEFFDIMVKYFEAKGLEILDRDSLGII